MLRSMNDLTGFSIGATDGFIGTVQDFLLDEREWAVRYLVADTGTWLSGRLVILSPSVLGHAEASTRVMNVELTREQVSSSPPLEADQPVSRQKELELAQYYGWPMYWSPSMAGAGAGVMAGPWMTAPVPEEPDIHARPADEAPKGDPHLHSAREVTGYHVEAVDGEIGHVEDFIVDDTTWSIQYVVVDTKNWWPAKKVVLLPMWVSEVSWDLRRVRFDLPRETIRSGPEYDPSAPVNEEHELRFYDYYGRPKERI